MLDVPRLISAIEALEIIVHQGEGVSDERWADEAHRELTHYHKFKQIADGVSPIGAVRPAVVNPRTEDLPAGLQSVSDLFNAFYRMTFATMERLFGADTDRSRLVGRLYTLMSDCLAPTARYLMTQPVGSGLVAGPSFEWYESVGDLPSEVSRLAESVLGAHPDLAEVIDAVAHLDDR